MLTSDPGGWQGRRTSHTHSNDIFVWEGTGSIDADETVGFLPAKTVVQNNLSYDKFRTLQLKQE